MNWIQCLSMGLIVGLMSVALPGCAKTDTPTAKTEIAVNDMDAVRAPELEPNLGWLNTDHPLRFSDELKGRVVILDFWTYCCINCMHILPDLDYLEKKYADQPVVIVGVHSAKFANEANRETIRAAVQRYNIHHPVVIDDDMAIWNKYTAQGWPTFVVIDSRGRVMGMTSGEGHRDELDAAVTQLLKQGRENGTLTTEPLKLNPDASVAPTGELAFPGKVLADKKQNRLFVADSNHNRIVVSTLPDVSGRSKLVAVIGGGKEGKVDGKFTVASFHNPQGMALRGETLYIADTDNHLIRAAELVSGNVRTIAGTGEQGYDRVGEKKGTAQAISSPWDMELVDDGKLFIAMAGTHQIWSMDLSSQVVKAFSGSGRENIVDGSAAEANFAQPSGLTHIGGKLYDADSEVSGIREIDIKTGDVKTIVGRGLFVFGDVDGRGDEARLQHPLGITAYDDSLLVADTYNHKIKKVDPATREVKTLFGTGKPATKAPDGKPAFFGPSGLDVASDLVYIADTNNHRIVVIDMKSHNWNEVMISGLEAPGPKSTKAADDAETVAKVQLSDSAASVTLSLNAALPPNAHPSPDAPMQARVYDGEQMLVKQTMKTDKLPVTVELAGADIPSSGTLTVRWSFASCTTGNAAVCVPHRKAWNVPVEKSTDGGSSSVNLSVNLQ